jgi:hypothetical protein
VQRLESAFSAGSGDKKSVAAAKIAKLDDQAADVLFELDRTLATCDRVRARHSHRHGSAARARSLVR